jgi:hypothetical protein
MTTVLAVYNRYRFVALCDARCHNALQPTQLKECRVGACECICGGANHGLGLNHAVHNVSARRVGLTPEALQAFAQRRGLNADELVVIDRTRVQSSHLAKRWARKVLTPAPLVRGEDLFACEAVT